jgi:ATP-dependent helicase YprA (DUF1998 family)
MLKKTNTAFSYDARNNNSRNNSNTYNSNINSFKSDNAGNLNESTKNEVVKNDEKQDYDQEKLTQEKEENSINPREKILTEDIPEINSWDELDINKSLLRGIFAKGFEKPSPIQRRAIRPLILGKDIIAQAQSGTGKTGTFTIGALAHVDVKVNKTQILVLSPTRELSLILLMLLQVVQVEYLI